MLFENGSSGKGPSWTKAQRVELRAYPTSVADCHSSASDGIDELSINYVTM